jgi:hypothetical protein
MTAKVLVVALGITFWIASLRPQETPTISPSPQQTATASTTAPASRSVRISFVPPPLDGTISLGIYDLAGNLVRILHQQVSLDAFTIGADALVTRWDGKDDDGHDLPSGKYRARGYVVGALQLESVGSETADSPPATTNEILTVRLVPNVLSKNERPTVELRVGYDDTDSFLKTVDELPLFIITERNDITGITAAKDGEKSLEVWQQSAAGTEHFRISKLDQMMAFDCGSVDLK